MMRLIVSSRHTPWCHSYSSIALASFHSSISTALIEQFIEHKTRRTVGSVDFFIRRLAYLSIFGDEHGEVDDFLGFLQYFEKNPGYADHRIHCAIPVEILATVHSKRVGSLLSKYLSARFDSTVMLAEKDTQAFSTHLEKFCSKFPQLATAHSSVSFSFNLASSSNFLPSTLRDAHRSLPKVLFGDHSELSSIFVNILKEKSGLLLLNTIIDSVFACKFDLESTCNFTIQLLNEHLPDSSKLNPYIPYLEESIFKHIPDNKKGAFAMEIQKQYLGDSPTFDEGRPLAFINLLGGTMFRLYERSWPYFSNLGSGTASEPYYFKQLLKAYLMSKDLFPDAFSKNLFIWKALLRSSSFYSDPRSSFLLVESVIDQNSFCDAGELSIFPDAALSLIGSLPICRVLYRFLQSIEGLGQCGSDTLKFVQFTLDLYHVFVEAYKKLPFTKSVFINTLYIDQSFIPLTLRLVAKLNIAQVDQLFSESHRIEFVSYLLLAAAKDLNGPLLGLFVNFFTSLGHGKVLHKFLSIAPVGCYLHSLKEAVGLFEKNRNYFQQNSALIKNVFLGLGKEVPFVGIESIQPLSDHICKRFDTVCDLRKAHAQVRSKCSIISFVREKILPREHRAAFDLIAPIFKAMVCYPSTWPINVESEIENFTISSI
ncbi:hypothetical protein MDAP_001958 [Mitosporidium daphniae]|uniref:Uncharacterized protein n=1 Tax=Mitosporidium daphniae TaxID=1485682 RepID=A0A098VLN7_9MICR|nr:uncharacterized protein DI09_94p60 [Mitosporidium daphniae]KGG50012.1 hypothetical protein DI09_94p60 [Mitosporidium daphniae]|eukprot:XP_013236448.1 uncharacterized protein DI09_94p60 [Mitosporidium daphniae]